MGKPMGSPMGLGLARGAWAHDEGDLNCLNPSSWKGLDESTWKDITRTMWVFVDHANRIPSIALGVAMSLYSWFWWEGPNSLRVNVAFGQSAFELPDWRRTGVAKM